MKHQSISMPGSFIKPAPVSYSARLLPAVRSYEGFLVPARICTQLGDPDEDMIDFMDEQTDDMDAGSAQHPWKILVADDDHYVHDTTLLALSGVRIQGRPLEFLHAYSAKQAQSVIMDHPDIALLLLDVVMETVDAGLRLVNIIRNELKQENLRIVLRTGQPGYAPEAEIKKEFAIDAYTTKSQLTRTLLISVLNDTLAIVRPQHGLPN